MNRFARYEQPLPGMTREQILDETLRGIMYRFGWHLEWAVTDNILPQPYMTDQIRKLFAELMAGQTAPTPEA